MKADAYFHASEGHYSPEVDKLSKIDRFGLEAITGRRTFYYGELQRMITAENITFAYLSRKNSDDWADWASKNPKLAELLFEVENTCL